MGKIKDAAEQASPVIPKPRPEVWVVVERYSNKSWVAWRTFAISEDAEQFGPSSNSITETLQRAQERARSLGVHESAIKVCFGRY